MQLYETRFKAMGTACELRLWARTETIARRVSDAVTADVDRLEAKYSRYRADSELSFINAVAARGGSVNVDDETAQLLDYADTCHRESEGLFDISSGILRRAWDFKSGQLPTQETVAALLDRTGWHKLHWQRPQLGFPLPGMELDLGGIVKEYAADRAAALCLQHEAPHALINLGGDIRVTGPQADGAPWHIGISDPAAPERALCTVQLSSGALASSGDYQRCITIDGERYSHILDPFTGWPVRGLAAVSVVADLCVVAGSASTIAMLKGAQGAEWLADLGLQYLWVDTQGNSGGTLLSR
ncbi:MAG TPA: FAD:protein FMN transferase [Candidatus Acidoferrum sp.]|nr:FAD:protein FMN transferase [Candidatus Acidoferrum sp.]